jgi:hypothetical protein
MLMEPGPSLVQRVSLAYPRIDLEGLSWILSQLFGKQFLLFISEEDLEERIDGFTIVNRTLAEALAAIILEFPHLDWKLNQQGFILYDQNHLQSDDFKEPPSLNVKAFKEARTSRVKASLLELLLYVNSVYHRNIIALVDGIHLKEKLELEVLPDAPLGKLLYEIQDSGSGVGYECFEDVLYFTRGAEGSWIM